MTSQFVAILNLKKLTAAHTDNEFSPSPFRRHLDSSPGDKLFRSPIRLQLPDLKRRWQDSRPSIANGDE